MNFTLRVFGWMLNNDHTLHNKYKQSFYNISLSNFIQEIEQHSLCIGITQPDHNSIINFQKHVIPRKFDFSTFRHNNTNQCSRLNQDEFNRSQNCDVLVINKDTPCESCCKFNQKCIYDNNRKQNKLNEPAKLNAPIKNTRPERLKLTIQNHRLQNKQLQDEINKMKTCIENNNQPIDGELNKDFISLFSNTKENIPPFMKLFWEEQQKIFKTTSVIQVVEIQKLYSSQLVIKFCLSLTA